MPYGEGLMEIANPHDDPDAALLRAAQQDPYVMYLALQRGALAPLAVMLTAAAQATLACRDAFATDERFAADFAAWSAGSFRKVTLRARPAQWQTLLSEHAHALAGEEQSAQVACLPPSLRSQRPALLGKLQAYTTVEAGLPASSADDPDAPADAALLVVRADRQMSAGKLMAQAGHAALMLADSMTARAVGVWRDAGYPLSVRQADRAQWAHVKRTLPVVVVRDAGLTEIASGTETVIGVPPAAAAAAPSLARP